MSQKSRRNKEIMDNYINLNNMIGEDSLLICVLALKLMQIKVSFCLAVKSVNLLLSPFVEYKTTATKKMQM